jgi:beta-phosphoglucomutase
MTDALDVVNEWSARPDRAVIFDFNGTLCDDEPVLARIYAELFEEWLGWQMTTEDYVARLAGLSDREIVKRVLDDLARDDPGLVDRLLEERGLRYRQRVRVEPPVRRSTRMLVSRLAATGVPMAVVTGAQRADVDMVLAHSGVADAFAVVVAEEDVTRGKPDPEGFHAAAGLLGVDPGAVLVFEDSVPGARAARAAGMRVIGVQGVGASVEDLAAQTDAVVGALGAWLLDGLPGWSAADAGPHGDAGPVGAEQVEGMLDR